MSALFQSATTEHPVDVLRAALAFADRQEPFALAIVTNTEGGAVRAPGAMMAIGASGSSAGYVSGGCIDSDVCMRAQSAIASGKAENLRYGKGSPFIDIRLPCGGAIDLTVLPNPDRSVVEKTVQQLDARQTITLNICSGHLQIADTTAPRPVSFEYRPKLHLRIAGRGIEPVALANIAVAGGLTCELWSPDPVSIDAIEALGSVGIVQLTSPNDLPDINDGSETAFVLMFHDKAWETALLRQAVKGPAFYIGAVGSKATHATRRDQLIETGMTAAQLERIRGPIGLVPSMRDASMLAFSILAEIVHDFHLHASATK